MKEKILDQSPKVINRLVSPDKTQIYFNLIKPGESESYLYYKKWDPGKGAFSKAIKHPQWQNEPGVEILGFQTTHSGVYARVKSEGLIKKIHMKELKS